MVKNLQLALRISLLFQRLILKTILHITSIYLDFKSAFNENIGVQ